MKKYLAVLIAALFVIGMSAFTGKHLSKSKYTDVYFHFIPSDGSEGDYEDTDSWEVSSSNNECTEPSGDPCIIMISDAFLADVSTPQAKIQSLVDFLAEQNNELGEYANAESAVLDLTESWKP